MNEWRVYLRHTPNGYEVGLQREQALWARHAGLTLALAGAETKRLGELLARKDANTRIRELLGIKS